MLDFNRYTRWDIKPGNKVVHLQPGGFQQRARVVYFGKKAVCNYNLLLLIYAAYGRFAERIGEISQFFYIVNGIVFIDYAHFAKIIDIFFFVRFFIFCDDDVIFFFVFLESGTRFYFVGEGAKLGHNLIRCYPVI